MAQFKTLTSHSLITSDKLLGLSRLDKCVQQRMMTSTWISAVDEETFDEIATRMSRLKFRECCKVAKLNKTSYLRPLALITSLRRSRSYSLLVDDKQ